MTNNISINILSGKSKYFNSYALIYPFLRYRRELSDSGIESRIFQKINGALTDCEILILDSKVFRNDWISNRESTINMIRALTEGSHKTLWFNTGDSTGMIQDQVIDLVDRYYKNQLLRDRQSYRTSHYGGRSFTDFYFLNQHIRDQSEFWSTTLSDEQISKLRLSWNLGMNPCMDYWTGLKGRLYNSQVLLGTLHHKIPDPPTITKSKRNITISARMSTNYPRATVAYQRSTIIEALNSVGINTQKVHRKQYFSELGESKFAVSPFGWGEVCIRDFESILNGCVLVKPDMSHVETWPDIYIDGTTYLSFPWNLEYFGDWVEETLFESNYRIDISVAALRQYRSFIGPFGTEPFIEKIRELIVDLGL